MPPNEFVGLAERMGESLQFSDLETTVFTTWSKENMSALARQAAKNELQRGIGMNETQVKIGELVCGRR